MTRRQQTAVGDGRQAVAGRALTCESLARDFSTRNELTRRTIHALYGSLRQNLRKPAIRAAFDRWGLLFRFTGGHSTRRAALERSAGLRRFAARFELPGEALDIGRLIFCLHTLYAILAKALGFAVCARHAEPPGLGLNHWGDASDLELGRLVHDLERGDLFRATGVNGHIEDDIFGWYADCLTPALCGALRGTAARLAEYDLSGADGPATPARDVLGDTYLSLLPRSVRKALGEYYTPDWLARRLLDLLGDGESLGEPGARVLDPACGSGIFLVLAIEALRRSRAAASLSEAELLEAISRNVVGIDLNPLAVIAARTNYLLALGPLLRHRGPRPLEIPVFQADSILAAMPKMEPFDYIVGNPPWVGWENLPDDYRAATKPLWVAHGLFPHGGMDSILGKGRKDLSMLMTYVAAEKFLKEGGRLGFVITQAVFKMSGAAAGFRRFRTAAGSELCCRLVEDYSSVPVFDGASTKTALLVLEKGRPTEYPLSYTRVTHDKDARVRPTDLTRRHWQAEPADPRDPTSAWLTGPAAALSAVRKVLGRSDYRAALGVNTGGANAVYWFDVLGDNGDGTVMARNITKGAKRKISRAEVRIEKALLYPLLRARDAGAWLAVPGAALLFVQDVERRRGIAEDELARHSGARAWLERNRAVLEARSAFKRYFDRPGDPYWSMFNVGPGTLKPWKVVWPRIARRIQAAVVSNLDGKPVLPQETCSFIGLDRRPEAFYVAGVLNSTPLRYAVSCFSEPGGKSFGTPGILEKVRVPRYEDGNDTHRAIAAEAERLTREAGRPADADLGPNAVGQARLDGLCAALWSLAAEELAALCEAAGRQPAAATPRRSARQRRPQQLEDKAQ